MTRTAILVVTGGMEIVCTARLLFGQDWLVRLAAKRDPAMQQLLPLLGNVRNATSEKAKRVLGWSPRSNEEAVVATAESLMRFGLLKQ
jgi:hypothetical protein